MKRRKKSSILKPPSRPNGDRLEVLSELPHSFSKEYRRISNDDALAPAYEHLETGLEFRLIPAGEFTFGLSAKEDKAARQIENPPSLTISELRPARRLFVNSFLVSASPILVGTLRRLEPVRFKNLDGASYRDFAPAYVEREEALGFAQAHGWRLLFEAEWEYATRARTSTLFAWGNELLPEKELKQWLEFDIPENRRKRNRFGLRGLFSGDWCMDRWTDSHSPSSVPSTDVYVVKGGGSIFWPWQGSGEWVWCMPANRMPSTGLIEGRCAFRLVRDLNRNTPVAED